MHRTHTYVHRLEGKCQFGSTTTLSTGNPAASNTPESARPFRHYRFKVKRILRTWQSGLSFASPPPFPSLSSRVAPLCGRENGRVPALSARRPTKPPSSNPTCRFRHSNLARIPAANVLSRPDKDRILREIKSLRYPSVRVTAERRRTSAEKRFTPPGCKSPSRFQRELDYRRSRQTSLVSGPFRT